MSQDLLPSFKLERGRDLRESIKPEYIIINHSYDFLKSSLFFSPALINDNLKIQHHEFIKLAKDEYRYNSDFSHYFIELVGKHYRRLASLGLRNASPFIKELINEGLLHSQYSNSLLITVLGNYSEETGDIVTKEIYNHLGYLTSDLLKTFNLGRNKVVFLGEIFDFDKNSKLKVGDRYNVTETRMNSANLNLYISRF